MGKTVAAKRLAAEKNISVWEAERQLDAKLFLDEIPKWEPGGPHYSLLYQKLFTHTKAARLKEYHQGICQGHWQASPERSPQVEISTVGLLIPSPMYEEILTLYQEVYQLKRDPGEVQCSENMVEETCIEILDALKEHLWFRWGFHPLRRA